MFNYYKLTIKFYFNRYQP